MKGLILRERKGKMATRNGDRPHILKMSLRGAKRRGNLSCFCRGLIHQAHFIYLCNDKRVKL